MVSVSKYPTGAAYERVEKDQWGTYTETKYNYIDRVKVADGYYAYTTLIASKSGTASKPGRVKTTGFGFNIPNGARIDSITVEWKNYVRNNSGGTSYAPNIPSVKANLLGNSTLASKVKTKTGPVPTSATRWSLSWTASETGLSNDVLRQVINSSGFGVYLNPQRNTTNNIGYYYVDYVKVTVTYSIPSWSIDVSSTPHTDPDKRNISVYIQDSAGIVKSGTYQVQLSLSEGLSVTSVALCEGSLSGGVWTAAVQSDSRADLQFTVKTSTQGTGNYTVTASFTPLDTGLSDSDTFSLTLTPPAIGGLVPSYSYSETDEYAALPSTGSYGTSFTLTNTSGSAVSCTVEYDTTDYAGYTVTGGSFTEGTPGTWTINASSTSTLTLKYNPTGKRYIRILKDSTVLYRRAIVPYDYNEKGYGYLRYPVNDDRSGEYRFTTQIRASTTLQYPHLLIQAPGCGYNVRVYDLNGNEVAVKSFGSYNLYRDYVTIDFTFITTNGVGWVDIEGPASYSDWDRTAYTLDILTPVLTYLQGGVQDSGGVQWFSSGSTHTIDLEPGESSEVKQFKVSNASVTGNIYGASVKFSYTSTQPVTIHVMGVYKEDVVYHRSFNLPATSTPEEVQVGGPGDFLGLDATGDSIVSALNDMTTSVNLKLKNPGGGPARVKITDPALYLHYAEDPGADGFSFNGRHSSQYNAFLSDMKDPQGENRSVKFYEAKNTDLKIPGGWQGETRELEMKISVMGDDLRESRELSRYISEWLSTDFWGDGSVGYGELVFDFDPTITYKVIRTEPITSEIKGAGYIDLTVKFTIIEAYNSSGGCGGEYGTIRGVRSVRPTIDIICTGGPVTLVESISGAKIILKGEWKAGDELTIDCRRRRVYNSNGKFIRGAVDIGSDWFELKGKYDLRGSAGCRVTRISYTEYY